LLSNSFAIDLCILANLAFDGPNLVFLHKHNDLAILISRESCTMRLPPFFACRLLSSRGDEGDPSPPPFLAATRGYLEQCRRPRSSSDLFWRPRSLPCGSLGIWMPRCYLGLLPRSDLDDLDQAAMWTCGINTAARRARELAATGEGIARNRRRNCAQKRKRPRDARENFLRR